MVVSCLWDLWTVVVLWTKTHHVDLVSVFFSCLFIYLTTRFVPPLKARTVKIMGKKIGVFGERSVDVSPEWFSERTAVTDTKNAWVMIEAIEEDKTHFFFFLSKILAFIVPKRAFSSPAEAQIFVDKSHRYWQAAKNGTPVTAEDGAVWPPAPCL